MPFSANTTILTDGGYKNVTDYINLQINLIDQDGRIFISKILKQDQECAVNLTFSDGSTMTCNRNQRFQTADGVGAFATDLIDKKLKFYNPALPEIHCTNIEITTKMIDLYSFDHMKSSYAVVNNLIIHY